jgi:hypothetical protein
MTTETVTAKPQKPPTPEKPASDAIPVKLVRFVAPTDVPGQDVATNLKTHGEANRRSWTIHYLPSQRHFRIVYCDPNTRDGKGVELTAFVHETRVSIWERAE